MKSLLPLLLLTSLLLSACNLGGNDNLFKKKQECAKYIESIPAAIQRNTQIYQNRSYEHTETFLEMFYSPIKNSCLYSVKVREVQDGEICNFYKIYDYLSGGNNEIETYLAFEGNSNKCAISSTENKYQKALKELKGE